VGKMWRGCVQLVLTNKRALGYILTNNIKVSHFPGFSLNIKSIKLGTFIRLKKIQSKELLQLLAGMISSIHNLYVFVIIN